MGVGMGVATANTLTFVVLLEFCQPTHVLIFFSVLFCFSRKKKTNARTYGVKSGEGKGHSLFRVYFFFFLTFTVVILCYCAIVVNHDVIAVLQMGSWRELWVVGLVGLCWAPQSLYVVGARCLIFS